MSRLSVEHIRRTTFSPFRRPNSWNHGRSQRSSQEANSPRQGVPRVSTLRPGNHERSQRRSSGSKPTTTGGAPWSGFSDPGTTNARSADLQETNSPRNGVPRVSTLRPGKHERSRRRSPGANPPRHGVPRGPDSGTREPRKPASTGYGLFTAVQRWTAPPK